MTTKQKQKQRKSIVLRLQYFTTIIIKLKTQDEFQNFTTTKNHTCFAFKPLFVNEYKHNNRKIYTNKRITIDRIWFSTTKTNGHTLTIGKCRSMQSSIKSVLTSSPAKQLCSNFEKKRNLYKKEREREKKMRKTSKCRLNWVLFVNSDTLPAIAVCKPFFSEFCYFRYSINK